MSDHRTPKEPPTPPLPSPQPPTPKLDKPRKTAITNNRADRQGSAGVARTQWIYPTSRRSERSHRFTAFRAFALEDSAFPTHSPKGHTVFIKDRRPRGFVSSRSLPRRSTMSRRNHSRTRRQPNLSPTSSLNSSQPPAPNPQHPSPHVNLGKRGGG